MKKQLFFWLLTLLPLEVCADNLIDGIYYYLNSSDLTATVVSHSGKKYSGNVVIPSTVAYSNKTYTVTTIGNEAFYQCTSLTSVSIPNSVTEIRQSAFEDCDGLSSIIIPGSVTTIGDRAFTSCNYVTSLTLSEGLEEIGSYAFAAAGSLTSIIIPNGVKTIGGHAFYSCINVTSITIPESVTYIGENAFESCQKLISATIPNGVTSINYGTFLGCLNLTSVTIPNSVTTIGGHAFSNCEALTSVTIPNSVTTIGDYAFSNCEALTSVTIPNSVTTIGDYAFYYCKALTSVTIGNGVTSIGNYAFDCDNLIYVTMNKETPPSIQSSVFSNRANATLYVPSNSVYTYKYADYWKEFGSILSIGTLRNINSSNISINFVASSLMYNGSAQTPDIIVKDGNITLINETDYTLSYSNTSIGSGTITITGIGQYTGTRNQNFYISPKPLNWKTITVSDIAAVTYNGSAQTPAVTVKDGTTTLTSGTDYTVSYSDNINPGTATVTITGMGGYTGTRTANFTISPIKDVSSLTISEISAVTYNGSAQTPAVTVKDGTTTLVNGTDYTVSYSNNINAGMATVTLTGMGNYTGTKTANFTINAKNVSSLTISDIAAVTYNGSAQTPAVTVKDGTATLVSGTDYTVAYSNNTNVGSATVTVTGKGNYTGTKTANFTINAKNASSLTISDIAAVTYNGSAQTPAVTVKDGSTTLTSGTHYTVAYSNNTNAGTATVTVTGKGNYTGTKTANFTINAKSASNLTISSIAAVTYNGSAQTPAVTVKDGSTTLTSGTHYTVAYSNNTNAGTATVTITGKGNYTGTKTANFTINPQNASSLTISDIAAVTYNGLAQMPAVTVKDGSTTLTNGTHYTVGYSNNANAGTATVTITGKGNYTGTKTANFTINKAPLTVTAQSYTIMLGDPLPTFECTYSGFKNSETAGVLTTQPTISCSATSSSAPGTYDIIVSGGSATNYAFTYVNGTLTIDAGVNIQFADNTVKSICVAKWDTDGDGEISYDEAAAVTTVSNYFKSTSITSFDEFVYFTGVTSIGTQAFSGCLSLTSITISNSVTSIGWNAFSGCYRLTSITIPNSVTSIGQSAFYNCSGLESVTIGDNVTSIGSDAFKDCSDLISVTALNPTPGAISSNVFSNRTNATLYVPKGSKEAYQAANYWKEFKEIKEIMIEVDGLYYYLVTDNHQAQVTSMPKGKYTGNITIPSSIAYNNTNYSVTSIGRSAFQNCSGLESVTIGNSVTSIGIQAFYGCSGLESVTIPNSVTSIDAYAFSSCSGLKKVIVSDIAAWCGISFYDGTANPLTYAHHLYSDENTKITNLVIPDGVSSIGSSAFYGCSGLESVTIPTSVTSIGSSAFRGCSGFTSIGVELGNTKYDSRDNCNAIIETASNTLIAGCKNTVIPTSVTSIGNGAFYNCSGLESVTIPTSVMSIGSSAFYNCSDLESVTIPTSVTSIGELAFSYCSGLTSVTVDINTPLSITANTFTNRTNATLYVPKNSKTAYQAAGYWKEFKAIKEFPDPDVNQDGTVNVVDVVDIARFVVGTPRDLFVVFLADLNNSGEVNVADAIVLVNEIAGDTQFTRQLCVPEQNGSDVLTLCSIDNTQLSLQLDGSESYAAFQFDLWLPSDMDVMQLRLNDERRQGHQLLYNKVSNGHYRVVALSTSGNAFNGTSGELLGLTFDGFAIDEVRMENIHFVTTNGTDVLFDALGVTFSGGKTVIHSTENTSNGIEPTYNLNGQRLESPRKGINIIGGKKIVVK